jgi:hypothetical protein
MRKCLQTRPATQYEQRVSNWVFPVMFGELAFMLWLIFMGAKERQPQASAA